MKSCLCNRCDQGRNPCPCPASCEVPESDPFGWVDRLTWRVHAALLVIAIVLLLLASAGLIHK